MSSDAPVFSLENLADINQQFENAYPQDILRWATATFGPKLAVVTSFQITGIVTLHMLKNIAPDVPILTLDTGLLFPETYDLMQRVEAFFGIKLVRIHPELTLMQQADQYGPALWERDPEQCCYIRKVVPLKKALHPYAAWITGLRRDQSALRSATKVIMWDKQNEKIKVAPFASWTEDMLWTYIHEYKLPYNALHDHAYPSIGCMPCTQPVMPDQDKRAGRWANLSKTECGIHFGSVDGTP